MVVFTPGKGPSGISFDGYIFVPRKRTADAYFPDYESSTVPVKAEIERTGHMLPENNHPTEWDS